MPRSRYLMALALAGVLLAPWTFRACARWGTNLEPRDPGGFVAVEIRGDVPAPGVYAFTHEPTVAELEARAGVVAPNPGTDPERRLVLRHGASVDRWESEHGGARVVVGSIPPRRGLALGLRVDLNRGDLESLEAVPGLSARLARRIVRFRTKAGPIPDLDTLVRERVLTAEEARRVRPFVECSPWRD